MACALAVELDHATKRAKQPRAPAPTVILSTGSMPPLTSTKSFMESVPVTGFCDREGSRHSGVSGWEAARTKTGITAGSIETADHSSGGSHWHERHGQRGCCVRVGAALLAEALAASAG